MLQERTLISILLLSRYLLDTDCFQWSPMQESSHVISTPLGSNVTLPCDFVLTSQEQQSFNQFHIISWSKEEPKGSNNWTGVALRAMINQQPQVFSDDNNGRVRMVNNTLVISNVELRDASQYQCEVRSSFYTTPSKLKLNVLFKPVDTKIIVKAVEISSGERIEINCTSRENPPAKYVFYVNGVIRQNSSSSRFVVDKARKEHEGRYTCVPWNVLGEGPAAVADITVFDVAPTDKGPQGTLLTTEIIAGIAGGGGVLIIIIIILAVVICHKNKPVGDETDKPKRTSRTNKALSRRDIDVSQAYIGPGIYGSQSLEGVNSEEYRRSNGGYQFTSSISLQNSDGMTPPKDTHL